MIPLARPFFGPEEEEAVAEVLRSGWVAQGPTTAKLEEEFAPLAGVPHAIATSSCTTALHLAIVACGVGPGDEVILPSFTFPATANAVLYEGAIPVLVDIDPATLNIDVRAAERAIGPRTRAILGVHLFGAPCEIRELRALCDARGLSLIEDAACAVGTEFEGRPIGSWGHVACFSFHARKIVTCGEGGMVTTADDAKAANAWFMSLERALLAEEGLPDRFWFRHLVYAPLPSYAAETLPGIREAVLASRDPRPQIALLTAKLKTATAAANAR